jgi:hypothetical protein
MVGMLAVHRLRELYIDPATHAHGRTYLSAASGLVRDGEQIYVVADDEYYLGVFDARAPGAPGGVIRLFEGELPMGRKKRKSQKPDIETLARLPAMPDCRSGALLGLGSGSGSRPNRNTGVLMALGHSSAPVLATALQRYELGDVAGVPLCFTDGAPLPDGGGAFSAVAEEAFGAE